MKFVLLGPPNSGKDTQAERIKKKFDIPHISSGNILRDEVSRKTDFGMQIKPFIDRREIGPEEQITDFLLNHIDKNCPSGFILDGFPRTIYQAQRLDKKFPIVAAILLEVPNEEIIKRITSRRVCNNCNRTYHMKINPPKRKNICDHCDIKLTKRADDNAKTVKKRLRSYYRETQPVIDYYQHKEVLRRIDGRGDPDSIFNEILSLV
jgi:adenylate kinase